MNAFMHIGLLVALYTLAGCGQGSKNNGLDNSKKEAVEEIAPKESEKTAFKLSIARKVTFNKDFDNLDLFKKHINDYVISFDAISGSYEMAKVVCQKTSSRLSTKIQGDFDRRGISAKVNLNLDPTDKNIVEFKCDIIQNDEEIDSAKVILKKSIVISGETFFDTGIGDGNLDTLVIEKGSSIVTNGQPIKINVKSLISDRGALSTFKKNLKSSPDNLPGLSGQAIYLNAEEAFGHVFIQLIGLNGGKQTIGPGDQRTSHNPPKAVDGKCRNGVPPANEALCKGEDGLKGFPGLLGLKGQNGGDTGSIDIRIARPTNLTVSIDYTIGKGSEGGPGGEGGIGQFGGTGNTISWVEDGPNNCSGPTCRYMSGNRKITRKYPDGKNGDQGDKGPSGQPGLDGKTLTSMIMINDTYTITNSDWTN